MSRSRAILVVLVFVLVIPVVGLAYLQTESGFGGVLVPVANRFAPGSLEVSRGRLGLGGSLQAQEIRFESEELGIRVAIEDFFVDVSLTSLLSGPGPQIDRLRLQGAEIEVRPPEEVADEQEPEPQTEPEPEADGEGRLLLPASIAEAEIRDLRLSLLEGDDEWARLSSEQLTLTGLVPGETGRITWLASGHLESTGEDPAYESAVDLKAEVGRTPDGFIEEWAALLVADVSGIPDARQTRFSLDSTGSFPAEHEVKTSTRLRAEREGEVLGEVDASVSTSVNSDGGGAVSASVVLHSLNEAFLNPLIAPLRRGLIKQARIAGSLDVTADLPIDVTGLSILADGELSIERFDYRTLSVSGARLTVDATPGKLIAELGPTRINRGRVSARVSLEESGDEERLQAVLRTRALDLTALAEAFREDLPTSVEGILDLSASVSSKAPPDADLRETVNGSVQVKLARGRIEGFNLMSFLAEQSGVEAFKAIPIDDFDVNADVEIKDGVAYFEEDEVKAAAAELVVNGTVALQGSADLTIEAFVGPSVSKTLARFGIDAGGLEQYERMTSLPVAVRVSGPFENLSYGPTTPRTAERTGKAVDSGSQQFDKAVKGVSDWFKKK
jgi:hypothetical protein